jgi:hypothetical protein
LQYDILILGTDEIFPLLFNPIALLAPIALNVRGVAPRSIAKFISEDLLLASGA